MKKIIATALIAVFLVMMFAVTAAAEVSPTAKPVDGPGSDSPTSPQTGDSVVLIGTITLLMAAAASCVAVKKIKG